MNSCLQQLNIYGGQIVEAELWQYLYPWSAPPPGLVADTHHPPLHADRRPAVSRNSLDILYVFGWDVWRHLQLPYILKVSLLGTRGPATCTVSSAVTPDPDIARSKLKS